MPAPFQHFRQMQFDAIRQDLRIVAAFQHADELRRRRSASATSSTRFVKGMKSSVSRPRSPTGSRRWASKPALSSTSSGLIWAANFSRIVGEDGEIILPRRAVVDGQVERRAQPAAAARLVGVARAGIERPAVDREEADLRVFPERGLRAVAVMDVPIDDQHAV